LEFSAAPSTKTKNIQKAVFDPATKAPPPAFAASASNNGGEDENLLAASFGTQVSITTKTMTGESSSSFKAIYLMAKCTYD
jgi:hypothetical protein